MNKRILSIALVIICVSLAVVFTAALAQTGEETVVINPARWDPGQTVYSDQEIVFEFGWLACRQGLVQDYLTAVNIAFVLDGESLFASRADANQYWGPVHAVAASPAAEFCMGATPANLWAAYWSYSYGHLSAGDHPLYFANRVNHPVTDGFDLDEDGDPDLYQGVLNERAFTIHVENRPPE